MNKSMLIRPLFLLCGCQGQPVGGADDFGRSQAPLLFVQTVPKALEAGGASKKLKPAVS